MPGSNGGTREPGGARAAPADGDRDDQPILGSAGLEHLHDVLQPEKVPARARLAQYMRATAR